MVWWRAGLCALELVLGCCMSIAALPLHIYGRGGGGGGGVGRFTGRRDIKARAVRLSCRGGDGGRTEQKGGRRAGLRRDV